MHQLVTTRHWASQLPSYDGQLVDRPTDRLVCKQGSAWNNCIGWLQGTTGDPYGSWERTNFREKLGGTIACRENVALWGEYILPATEWLDLSAVGTSDGIPRDPFPRSILVIFCYNTVWFCLFVTLTLQWSSRWFCCLGHFKKSLWWWWWSSRGSSRANGFRGI